MFVVIGGVLCLPSFAFQNFLACRLMHRKRFDLFLFCLYLRNLTLETHTSEAVARAALRKGGEACGDFRSREVCIKLC